ncbi:hypothetical protein QQ045_019545 [Rhodiola kirilowii]
MSKAFDRVEWDFLELMLVKLGFPDGWIGRVMECVLSVTYAVSVNNMMTEDIRPERGISQGDPLSPYLFLIVTEWLNMKLKEMHDRGEVNGVRICREAPEVTHLLFADDSMFFLKADHKNAYNLKRVMGGV